ncbi:hypothetical protein HG530_006667 [Fusarium avenaceum]|nr:hypothetical protein HG530_006667 [Fusarium avenaceum]
MTCATSPSYQIKCTYAFERSESGRGATPAEQLIDANASVRIPNSSDSAAIVLCIEAAVGVLVSVHGNSREQAFAALVGDAAAGKVAAAHARHAPAEGVAVALVALQDLIFCFVVGVTVFDVAAETLEMVTRTAREVVTENRIVEVCD